MMRYASGSGSFRRHVMSATTKTGRGAQVSTVDHVIRRGPSADKLWAEFRIGGTVEFTAVKGGGARAHARLRISARIIKLTCTAYHDRFFFQGDLVAIGREGCELVEVRGFHVVGCYEMSSQLGWIEARPGSVPL